MRFDVFFSICQNEIHGVTPNERTMFENFFDQVQVADLLGFETAWVAESHLSSEVQKQNRKPVIPNFRGEVGLNTDIAQLALQVFSKTKNIGVGSAIKNILCNGGPLAHAESIRYCLSLHSLRAAEKRKLHVGFAAGRFDYSNRPYGVCPRNPMEEAAWPQVKAKCFLEAVEIFCRALRGDVFSSEELGSQGLLAHDFPNQEAWDSACKIAADLGIYTSDTQAIPIPHFWNFEKLRIIPKEAPLDLLSLTLGSHDPRAQKLANSILPCKVFNLSITPTKVIEETHLRMHEIFHPDGGPWKREYMPRTVLIFLESNPHESVQTQRARAKERAQKALEVYWEAVEGTLNPERIAQAVENSLYGCPQDVVEQIRERFHPEDKLMLWFDFNCHDNEYVKESMRAFAEHVMPQFIN